MLIDAKDRHYLITLQGRAAAFHTHAGIVQHDDIIGVLEGSLIRPAPSGSSWSLRPTLSDVVLEDAARRAGHLPKDLGTILMQADVGPGHARARSRGRFGGAVDDAAARRRAHHGLRDPRGLRVARHKNVHDMLGDDVAYDVHIRDVTEGIDEIDLDRVILDMPEPWDVVNHAEGALRPGGILLAYLPTINQTQLLREALQSPRLRARRDRRDPAANVAHRRTFRATRSSDGCPHRVSHLGATPGGTASRAI